MRQERVLNGANYMIMNNSGIFFCFKIPILEVVEIQTVNDDGCHSVFVLVGILKSLSLERFLLLAVVILHVSSLSLSLYVFQFTVPHSFFRPTLSQTCTAISNLCLAPHVINRQCRAYCIIIITFINLWLCRPEGFSHYSRTYFVIWP